MKLKELGSIPISDAAPAGQDVKYEPEFEQLQQEIDKLSIASVDGAVIDWKKVTQLSSTILSKKSKDLLVACYLSIALVQTHEFDGFVAGVTVLDDLVATFWDTLFPPKKRMRGRLNALSWWADRAKDFLQNYTPQAPLPKEAVQSLRSALASLDQNLAEKTEDAAPPLLELLNAVDRLPVQEPEPEPEPEPESEPAPEPEAALEPEPVASQAAPDTAQAAPQPAPAAPAFKPAPVTAPSGTEEESTQILKNAAGGLLSVADFKLKSDLSDPVPYQLLRTGVWSQLKQAPPAQNGATMIPPPESVLITSFQNMLSAGSYANAIVASEERIPQFMFWLDLNRFTAQALNSLGNAYKSARDVVCVETLLFTQRLQGIEELTFSDGTPFADQETKAWLQTIGIGQAGGGIAAGGDEQAAAVSEALTAARKLVQDNKALDGIQLIEDGLNHAGSGKERALWNIALCRIFLQLGKADLAVPVAEQIVHNADTYQLEKWDTGLCIECYGMAYDILSVSKQEEAKARALEILQRITQLSPTKALRIAGIK